MEKKTLSFIQSPPSFLSGVPIRSTSLLATEVDQMIMAETENTAHLRAWRNSASLSIFKMLNSKMKEAKENSITQRLIIPCADYSGFLLCPPLPLVPVIRPFHCSLAGRRRKEQRGKVKLADFSIYEQVSEGGCSNYWLQRFFGN